MNLKNYTTEIASTKSIGLIEKVLIDFGAFNIMKEYVAGKCSALSFIINVEGARMPFKVVANTEHVSKWLSSKKPSLNKAELLLQAERIAWKNQYELIFIQLGMVESNQIEPLQIFLPYLYDPAKDQTYYSRLKEGGFKALLPSAQ